MGFPLTPPIIYSRSLAPVMYWAVRITLCSTLWVRCRAVAVPGGDANGQDAFDGAAVALFEDLGSHAKCFQSPEGENVSPCLLHNCLDVFGP